MKSRDRSVSTVEPAEGSRVAVQEHMAPGPTQNDQRTCERLAVALEQVVEPGYSAAAA